MSGGGHNEGPSATELGIPKYLGCIIERSHTPMAVKSPATPVWKLDTNVKLNPKSFMANIIDP